MTLAGYKAEQVRFTGQERSFYQSSPGAMRAYCRNCGTPLTWEGGGVELSALSITLVRRAFRHLGAAADRARALNNSKNFR